MADWTHWTDAEIRELRQRLHRRETFAQISAAITGRSRAACVSKARKLGLIFDDRAEQCRRGFERRRAQRALTTVHIEDRHV